MTANTKKKSLISGVVWSAVEIFIKRALDLVVKLLLARLLFPEDFGLVGMATVFISLIQAVNDGGMGQALIQKKEKDTKETHFHTVFWTAMGWTLFLYIFIYFLVSPFVAWFYNEPLLENIVRVLSISLFFNSLNAVHKAQLMKGLKFKKIAFVHNVSSVFAGAVAVTMALLDFGVWALVMYTALSFFVAVPLFYRATGWKPKLIWEKQAFREIFGFGVYTTITNVIQKLASNVDYLIIGKFVSAAALGAYTLAYMLTSMVKAQLTTMINRVLYPFYSSIQDDLLKLKSYYLKTLKYYGIVVFPIMGGFLIFGDSIVPLFFGDKWEKTILPMKILAIAASVDVATSGYNMLFRSIGKPKRETKIQLLVMLFFLIPAIFVGVHLNGMIGVAYGILVSMIFKTAYVQFFLKKEFDIYLLDVVTALQSPFVIVTSLAVGFYFINANFAYPIVWLVLYASLYLLITAYFNKGEITKLIKQKKKNS